MAMVVLCVLCLVISGCFEAEGIKGFEEDEDEEEEEDAYKFLRNQYHQTYTK